jgi:hypothetical protein
MRLMPLCACIAVAAVLAGCSASASSSSSSSAPAGAVTTHKATTHKAKPKPCKLKVTFDYIERFVEPEAGPPTAIEIGNVNFGDCKSSLDDFAATAPTGKDDCATVALASGNPGYDVNADPAPRLKHVIESAGPGC